MEPLPPKRTIRLSLVLGLAIVFAACQIHRPDSGTNQSAIFNAQDHSPLPRTCVGCHAKDRPLATSPAPNPLGPDAGLDVFFHSPQYGGDGDCVTCHNDPNQAGVKFTGATFDHLARNASGELQGNLTQVQQCVVCHENRRPSATQIIDDTSLSFVKTTFHHAKKYSGDRECVVCHSDPSRIGKTFLGAKFIHKDENGNDVTTCFDCHTPVAPNLDPW